MVGFGAVRVSGSQSLNVAAKICYFIVLAASFDLLLGYTGVVSFAHTMFFGIGGYGARHRALQSWARLVFDRHRHRGRRCCIDYTCAGDRPVLAPGAGAVLCHDHARGGVGLRGSGLATRWLTGGEDGRTFRLPELLRPGTRLLQADVFGVAITGRIVTYYLVFFAAVLLFLAMLRVVNSPFGRVLQAIRENDFRAEAIGYRTVIYRSIINCVSAVMATLAGVLCALWLRYTGPGTTLSFDIMLDILLMVVIGGMGTLYGP